ncbi:hypothetical protein PS9374_06936 [Planomonospora sphaerica]|uniref:Peptidase n=1 Tax=Planomonospora sphaerica TaxID=161355 RepID=A0A171DQA9_9ACTN|nr:hypothetical protein [Planomonospora sphaerica]GAT71245.1 hypothetical protein PS9374_06936 [Planomonospora sphaerica]
MRIRSIPPVLALTGALAMLCPPVYATVSDARQERVVITDVVEYRCGVTGVAETQDVKVKIELTMPADATAGEQMTIGWRGTYVSDATALRAPATGLAGGTKLYAYAAISGLAGLTSATGVGELASIGPGQIVPLPTAVVPLKTTSSKAGTAMVRPAAVNAGTRPTEPSIQCQVQNADALTTYPLAIASADDRPADPAPVTPSQSATTTATASTRPAPTVTATVTVQATASAPATSQPARDLTASAAGPSADGTTKVLVTPAGGAATGGGGEAGPDGRVLVSLGLLVTLAAVTGLRVRRRALSGG